MLFKIIHKDIGSSARTCEITTSRGIVNTPAFMPVATRGAIRALTLNDLNDIGFEMILANTYHLYIRPGIELLRATNGLHNFMKFKGPILTDSGGFQVFSLAQLCKITDNGVRFQSHIDGSSHFFSPEGVLDIQRVIGSDIMMVLDQCIEYPATEKDSSDAVIKTLNWAKRSFKHWTDYSDPNQQALFGIIQGSVFPDQRKKCVEELSKLDFSGLAIGGLSVGEPKELYREITEITVSIMPEQKPRYMMGVGSPMEILYAIQHGVDLFDCVLPTRVARNGALYTSHGKINIKASSYERDFSPLDQECQCYVCKTFSRAYLRHLYRLGEITSMVYNTYHNLFFMKSFMDGIRLAISEDRFGQEFTKWENIYGKVQSKINL
jgi:queuine tRNA-ribosyltransferase